MSLIKMLLIGGVIEPAVSAEELRDAFPISKPADAPLAKRLPSGNGQAERLLDAASPGAVNFEAVTLDAVQS